MIAIDDQTVMAVLAHMNGDHIDDNLVIARAFGDPSAESAVMSGLDATAGQWEFRDFDAVHTVSVAWSAPLEARQDVRREVVAIFERACGTLGIPIPDHR